MTTLKSALHGQAHFFHVTSVENWRAIQVEGLLPQLGPQHLGFLEEPFVSLVDERHLDQIKQAVKDKFEGAPIVVLQVAASDVLASRLGGDRSYPPVCAEVDHYRRTGVFVCYDRIPATSIVVREYG